MRFRRDVAITYTSVVGKSYRVEYEDDLAAPGDWLPVSGYDNVAGTGGELQAIDIGAALLPKRFYRVASLS